MGAGGHAKVIIDIIERRKLLLKENLKILGLYDDKSDQDYLFGYPILGNIEQVPKNEDENNYNYIISIGDNKDRYKVYSMLTLDDILYYTVIHPQSIIANSVKIGYGTIVVGGAVINPDAVVGNHSIINTGSTVGHDVVVEDFVHIAPGVNLAGNAFIRKFAFVGANCVILPGVSVGENSIIGAGSVVTKDIPPYCKAVGSPAKIISYEIKND